MTDEMWIQNTIGDLNKSVFISLLNIASSYLNVLISFLKNIVLKMRLRKNVNKQLRHFTIFRAW